MTFFTLLLGVAQYLFAYHFQENQLFDACFDHLDKKIGFDWLSFTHITRGDPLIHAIFALTYASLQTQTYILLFIVGMSFQNIPVRFATAYMISMLFTVILFAFFPAGGPFVLYGLTNLGDARYTLDFLAIIHHTMPVIDPGKMTGIISFPSAHTYLAVLITYYARTLPYLSKILLLINGIMVMASVSIGGHYLVDIIAGLIVAGIAIALTSWLYGEEKKEKEGWFINTPNTPHNAP